jgi:hypothetical protein
MSRAARSTSLDSLIHKVRTIMSFPLLNSKYPTPLSNPHQQNYWILLFSSLILTLFFIFLIIFHTYPNVFLITMSVSKITIEFMIDQIMILKVTSFIK